MRRRDFLRLSIPAAAGLGTCGCIEVDASRVDRRRYRLRGDDGYVEQWLLAIAEADRPSRGRRGEQYAALDRGERRKFRAVMRHERARAALVATLSERFPEQEFGSAADVLAWLIANWQLVLEIVVVLVKLFLLVI